METKRVEKKPSFATVYDDKVSGTWNVTMDVDGIRIELAALDEHHARNLAVEINECAWIEVAP